MLYEILEEIEADESTRGLPWSERARRYYEKEALRRPLPEYARPDYNPFKYDGLILTIICLSFVLAPLLLYFLLFGGGGFISSLLGGAGGGGLPPITPTRIF